MNIEAAIAMHEAAIAGRQAREAGYAMQAAIYTTNFDAAYGKRMQRMAEDGRHFREVTVPSIMREVALLRYERNLAARNSGMVPEPANQSRG